jgi:hypothetical protein
MTSGAPEPYERAVRAVAALLAALPGPTMLIGGLAVIAHGHVRTTDDIDATASGLRVAPEQIVAVAATFDIHPRIDRAVEFARSTQVLLEQLRSYRLGVEMERLLFALALYKVQKFLASGLRLRTACDLGASVLVVRAPTDFGLPTLEELTVALPTLVKGAQRHFASPPVTTTTFLASDKKPKDTKAKKVTTL